MSPILICPDPVYINYPMIGDLVQTDWLDDSSINVLWPHFNEDTRQVIIQGFVSEIRVTINN